MRTRCELKAREMFMNNLVKMITKLLQAKYAIKTILKRKEVKKSGNRLWKYTTWAKVYKIY